MSEKYESEKITVDHTKIWVNDIAGDPSSRVFGSRQEIAQNVGYPVLSACEDLYDKNIRTVESIWKKEEVMEHFHMAIIIINFDTLSPENQEVARQIAKEQGTEIREVSYIGEKMHTCKIVVPVSSETTAEEIEKLTKAAAARFQEQEKNW
ncbi:MAG: hypothetical protein ACOYMB_02225 [Patescibacteria group bacterium]